MKYLLIAVCMIVGCGDLPSARVNVDNRKNPVVKPEKPEVSAAAVRWIALAECIESEQIPDNTYLVAVVQLLSKNGKLSTSDLAAFDKAFPGITKGTRPLTKDDASKLRSLAL